MREQDEFSAISVWLPITLREARLKRGLTQERLAEISNVGEKTISSFETGARAEKVKLIQILRIARALHTTVDKLLAQPVAEARSFAPVESRSVAAPAFRKPPPRGVTIFRSSDSLQSSLGEARR